MINYYDSIDYLEYNNILDFYTESVNIIGINEGVGDILKNIKNGIVGFFRKIKEGFVYIINKITNKENVQATKTQQIANNIIKNTDENCNIPEDEKPLIVERIIKINDNSLKRTTEFKEKKIESAKNINSVKKAPEKTYKKSDNDFFKDKENNDGGITNAQKIHLNRTSNKLNNTTKMKLAVVFLKEDYVNKIVKDSEEILRQIKDINDFIEKDYKNPEDKSVGDEDLWRHNYIKYGNNSTGDDKRTQVSIHKIFHHYPDYYKDKDNGWDIYTLPEKEIYNTSYHDYPKNLLKNVVNQLEKSKVNNNKLKNNIDQGNKLLNESEKIVNSISLDAADVGWGWKKDEKGNWSDLDGRSVSKERVIDTQKFVLKRFKNDFNTIATEYRRVLGLFQVTLKEISEEIIRCNQYVSVINSATK